MTADEKDTLFETAKVTTVIRMFALPAITSSLVGSIYNIVDQIFIGQKIGTLGNAATNVAFPLVMLMVTFSMLFGVGGSSHFSLEIGGGKPENAAKVIGNSLFCMLASGIALMIAALAFLRPLMVLCGARGQTLEYAVSYTSITAIGIPFYILGTGMAMFIRADGSPKYAMCATISGAVLNTILDPVFLFLFDMGMEGAALATILGQIVSAVIALCYLKRFRHVCLDRSCFRPCWDTVKRVVSLGLPSGLMQIAVMLLQIVMNNTLGYYGEQSVYGRDIPLACVGIISKVSTVFNSLISGISQSCQPMLGYNYGAGNYRRVKETFLTAAAVVTAISTGAFLLFQLFPKQIMSIFGDGSPLYYEFGARYLRIFLFCTFVSGVQILCANFFPCHRKSKAGDGLLPEPSNVFSAAADPLPASCLGDGRRSVCRSSCRRYVRDPVGWHRSAAHEEDAGIRKRPADALAVSLCPLFFQPIRKSHDAFAMRNSRILTTSSFLGGRSHC